MASDMGSLFLELAMSSPDAVKPLRGRKGITAVNIPQKGQIVQFQYQFAKHDPNPLVLITDANFTLQGNPVSFLRGVNLHMLGLSNIMKLLYNRGINACNNPLFSYDNIKPDRYIKAAFRMYKKPGIKKIRMLDCEYLKKILAASKKLNTSDLDVIRKTISDQIKESINPTIKDLNRE
jgi:hypothetical protein